MTLSKMTIHVSLLGESKFTPLGYVYDLCIAIFHFQKCPNLGDKLYGLYTFNLHYISQ